MSGLPTLDDYEVMAGKVPVADVRHLPVVKPWPTLEPLDDKEVGKPQAFPFHALGAVLGPAARAIARDVQCPDALAGGSILAAAALMAQPHADVVMPHGMRAPLSLFMVTAALSGDRKSACDAVANHPADEFRRQQAREHAEAVKAYEQEKASTKKGDPEPVAPVARSIVVSKGTVEGLQAILANQSHVGIISPEGGEMLGGHSMQKDKRVSGLAWLLKSWGAETLDSLTKGGGLSVLMGRRVTMHTLVQPVLLRELLSDPLAAGQGFLARCLIAEPETLAGTRMFRMCNPKEAPEVLRYYAAMNALLQRKAVTRPDGDGYELEPRPLPMSSEARALWVAFYDQVEGEQMEGRSLAGARAFASKAAEQAARIAGVIEMASDPDAADITRTSMDCAVQLTAFYISEHVRLCGVSTEWKEAAQLRALLTWLQEQGAAIQHRDVLRLAPNQLRNLKDAGLRPLLLELQRRGYIRESGPVWEVRQ